MLFEQWMEKSWRLVPHIVFTSGQDERILKVTRRLADTGLARPIILGNQFEIRRFAEESNIRLKGVAIRKPQHFPEFDQYCRNFKKQFAPDKKIPQIREQLQDVHLFALQMLLAGEAQLVFFKEVEFKQYLPQISRWLSRDQAMLSSFHLFWQEGQNHLFTLADAHFYPRPTPEQLANIAVSCGFNFEKLSGMQARIALLSFSSKGSADHPMVQTVQQAVQLARKKAPALKIEGELQFDAAFVPEIGRKKAAGNVLQGQANVYIFPSLGAANIALKIIETLTPFKTVGPIVQGLSFSVQFVADEVCEEGLFEQIIIASNLINV